MKLIAISDTHLKDAAFPQDLMEIIKDCDMVVHAGDFTSINCYKTLSSAVKLKAVYGNSDDDELKKLLPEKLKFEVGGVSIGVVHQGSLSITNKTALRYLALEMGVNVLIFGHLHRPLIDKSNVMLVCPGSPTSPRMADPTVVEMVIENGSVNGRIIEVKGKSCDYLAFSRSLGKNLD